MANSKKSTQSDKRGKSASTRPETAQPAAKATPSPAATAPAATGPAASGRGAESAVANPAVAAQPPPATPAKAQPRTDAQGRSPSQEQIAKRAYQIFQARGAHHGRHAEDWKQAEQELKLGTQ